MALEISVEQRKGIGVAEKGRDEAGQVVELDRRLFVQLQVFRGAADLDPVADALRTANAPAVLYADLSTPDGFGLMTYSEDPGFFTGSLRELLAGSVFRSVTLVPEMTMTGRSYAIGYEQNLPDVLLHRPIRTACNPEWPWCIWYPLRRSGEFATLPSDEQRKLLMEHGGVGRAYGKADLAHDIRLSCHGLDRNDNDFVVALIGKELTPLSKVVEHMRTTRQTALHMDRMGPFFVGRSVYRHAVYPDLNGA